MIQISYFTRIFAALLIAVVSFGVTHAKDVTASLSLSPSTKSNAASSLQVSTGKPLDSGIHLDVHTHVEHQTLSTLLGAAQQDKPTADQRSLKRFIISEERRAVKKYDGFMGMHIPLGYAR